MRKAEAAGPLTFKIARDQEEPRGVAEHPSRVGGESNRPVRRCSFVRDNEPDGLWASGACHPRFTALRSCSRQCRYSGMCRTPSVGESGLYSAWQPSQEAARSLPLASSSLRSRLSTARRARNPASASCCENSCHSGSLAQPSSAGPPTPWTRAHRKRPPGLRDSRVEPILRRCSEESRLHPRSHDLRDRRWPPSPRWY